MSRSILAFAAAVLLLPVGSSAAPVPTHLMPPELPIDFPTRVGTQWDYREGKHRWSISVVSVAEKDGAKVLSRMGRANGCGSPRGDVVVSPARVTEAGPDRRAAPRTLLVLPLRVGRKWEDQGWTTTVRGVEKVMVPAGEYEAVRVDEVAHSPDGVVTVTSWYARGVGLVKRVQRAGGGEESVRVLHRFRLGRE